MNDPEKITSIKNSEDHNRLIAEYEAKIEQEKQKALDWENACYKKDETILELKKSNERAEKGKPLLIVASSKRKKPPKNKTTS